MRHSRYATCCMLCSLYRTFLFQNIYILAPSKLYVIYKYMRNSYFVLIVYYGNFFLHHPVVDVWEIVGVEFVVIFDNCPDLDSRQWKLQYSVIGIQPLIGNELPLQTGFNKFPIFQIIGTSVQIGDAVFLLISVRRRIIRNGYISLWNTLRLQYLDAYPMFRIQFKFIIISKTTLAFMKQINCHCGSVRSVCLQW